MTESGRRCSKCGESYATEVIYCPRDGTPLTARKTEIGEDPYLGLTIDRQFRVEQLVGIGAMGRVYRAHQSGVERAVAVKVMHRDLLRHENLVARFRREARVGGSLLHPNLIQVFALGEIDALSPEVGGETYMVLEYLDGISLRSALGAAGGALPLPRALHVILQVCDALGEAHARGVVHRDLKPDNVMLVRRGDDPDFVKVLDFGVARLAEGDPNFATQAGAVFGTARYVSPEGAQGGAVGAPGDVYSLATMLFQALSGRTPFDGDSPVAVLVKHTSEPAPDVRSIARSSYVPEPLARTLAQNLGKNPDERCRDAREFGRALVQAARDSGLSPDDLIFRSTLLGSRGPLSLASVERTRALNLGESIRHAVAEQSGATEVLEPANESGTRGHPATPRPGVEPTLADEALPAERASRPTSEGDTLAARTSLPVPGSAAPLGSNSLPALGAKGRAVKALLIAACFALGGAIAMLIAGRLGAFEKPELGLDAYTERARRALALAAFDAPPGENVREITDTALHRWPDAESIRAVRRDAAGRLVSRARTLAASTGDRALAERWLDLALELDPANAEARALRHEAPPSPAVPAADNSASQSAEARPTNARARSRATLPAAGSALPSTSSTATAAPAPSSEPPESPIGGRWL